MSVDPVKMSDTLAWLAKAVRDALAAEQLFSQDKPLFDIIVYHCQQAAEKALKGYLFWHDTIFRRTHDLNELLHQCLAIDPTLILLDDAAQFLTPLALAFRYPGTALEPSLTEVEQALEYARVVLVEIQRRLPLT
jgi:HEPN domain-containing protein